MNKLFTLLLLCLVVTVNAQELRVDKIDSFTGDTIRITKDYVIGKSGTGRLSVSLIRSNSLYAMSIGTTAKQGCAGAVGNYVIFMNDKGEKLLLDNDAADIDCGDFAESFYAFKLEDFENFNPTSIRFSQSKGYMDYVVQGTYTFSQILNSLK